MKQFSFFRDFRGGPGEIRGKQIAGKLNGKLDPEVGYENDICIYILGSYPRTTPEPQYAYYDVLDCGFSRLSRLQRFTKGDIIAVSTTQVPDLKKYYPERKIYVIPQHHCNFKNELRPERPRKVVGCIGGMSAVQWPHWGVEMLLKEVGLEWKFEKYYSKRRAVVDFYKTIDIQLSFRPYHPRGIMSHMNHLKLANAGSFGIPTVSFPEPAYVDGWKNECLWGESIQNLALQAKKLADDDSFYTDMAQRVIEKSKGYHIDNIAKLYLELPGGE